MAAEGGSVEVLQLLLDSWPAGIRSRTSNDRSLVPLHVSVWSGRLEATRFLLEHWPEGSRVHEESVGQGFYPVHFAVLSSNLAILQLLVEQWPEAVAVRTFYGSGYTPLQGAAYNVGLQPRPPRAFPPPPPHLPPAPLPPPRPAPVPPIEVARVLLYSYPGSYAPEDNLQCKFVLYLGCFLQDPQWRDAAVNLQCVGAWRWSKTEVEDWLSCGGHAGILDQLGGLLVDVLEDDEAVELMKSVKAEDESPDWRLWAVPTLSLFAAAAAFLVEQLFRRRCCPSPVQDPFLEGAKQLVAKTSKKRFLLWRLWRYVEVNVVIIWVGTASIVLNPVWWLPFCALLLFVPAAAIYGPVSVFRQPVLALVTHGLASQVVAFLRLAIITLVYQVPGYAMDFARSTPRAMSTWNGPLAFFFEWGFSPIYDRSGKGSVWDHANKSLQTDWLFQWMGPVTAYEINEIVYRQIMSQAFMYTYVACLLCAMLYQLTLRCRPTQTSESPQQDAERAVQALLQKQPEEFREVNPRITPVRGWGWPWQGPLYLTVAMMFLDVALDINTVFAFLEQEQYVVAAIISFVVARSVLKQISILKPWRLPEALRASVRRGIVRQDVQEMLDEEGREEALVCALLTGYSLFMTAITARQMLVQLASFLFSTYSYSNYVARTCDMTLKLDGDKQVPTDVASEDGIDPAIVGSCTDVQVDDSTVAV